MRRPAGTALAPEAERLLIALASNVQTAPVMRIGRAAPEAEVALLQADLATRGQKGALAITAAGHAWLARRASNDRPSHVDPFTAQHLDLHQRHLNGPEGRLDVTINDAESPLAWLARRKGKDGHPLIEPTQLQAGERLRSQFTRAQLTPRVTSNWEAPIAQGGRSAGSDRPATFTEAIVSARQQVRDALRAVVPNSPASCWTCAAF